MELNNFQEVVEFALGREKDAVSFYQECSHIIQRNAMKEALLEMAEEELKHKNKFETEYDDHVFQED